MTALFTPELIASGCLLAALALIARWRLTGGRTGMILLPSLIWLGLVYLGIAVRWHDMDNLMVRQNFIRPALFLLLVSIILVEFNCIRLWRYRK